MTEKLNDIAVIGLAVMGQNFILNMADKGFGVAVYNRTTKVTNDFIAGAAAGKSIQGFDSIQELVASLERPRRVLILVKAGDPVDQTIAQLLPFLEPEDIIIDCGNSHYPDTERRYHELAQKGIRFVGSGISGGEEGARNGPSLMPGGDEAAWPHLQAIFEGASAKVDGKNGPEACTGWVGKGGAGHYVKMVHNGIEYGDMQLICEAYHVMKSAWGMSHEDMAETFSAWNEGVLDSYLIEITADILRAKDTDNSPLVEKILDKAGQKGTGKWTINSCLDEGIPVTLIAEAVFARNISSMKDERVRASEVLTAGVGTGLHSLMDAMKKPLIERLEILRQALYAAKIISYTQGYMLLKSASETNSWNLNFGAIALMWRGGCIIRSRFLGKIREAFETNPNLENLLLDPFFTQEIANTHLGLRNVVVEGALCGIPTPAFSTALSFLDSYRSAWLPHNLLQAQRDYFGAHTYQTQAEFAELGEKAPSHHYDWTGTGLGVNSGSYNA